MDKYILIYDIPRQNKALAIRVFRAIRKANLENIQHSVWESSDLEILRTIAKIIQDNGGEAIILRKKVVPL